MHLPFLTADPTSGLHYRPSITRLADLSLAPVAEAWRPGPVISKAPDPVWAGSLAQALAETIAAVTRALEDLVLATPDLRPPQIEALPDSRARRHLAALVALWQRMGAALPEGLAAVRHVLDLPHGHFLSPMPVVEGSLDPHAPAAMTALHDRLRAEFGSVPSAPSGRTARAGSRLHALQGGIAALSIQPGPIDESLSVWGLRDVALCAAFAAARARALIEAGTPARDIAVMTAEDPQTLARAFGAQGVPLSGLPAAPPQRDILGETALHLLLSKRAPAPAMALASLVLSPLMPWAPQTGRDLAEEVVAGDLRARMLDAFPDHRALWEDLRAPASSLAQLRLLANRICARLTRGAEVRERMPIPPGEGPPDWDGMLRDVVVMPPETAESARNLEGVSLWSAEESPWRPCRHLIACDFTEGQYPARPTPNPLFLDSEIEAIRSATGLQLGGRAQGLARSLARFDEQLRSVSDSVTFLVPWRDLMGDRLAPSAGLSLIARAVSGAGSATDLVRDLSQIAPNDWPIACHWPRPLPAPDPLPEAIQLAHAPLSLRLAEDGTVKPQSPSRLETLLVSPLAWLLGEIGADDLSWAAETLDVLTMGSIAHEVFETVFAAGEPAPKPDDLPARVASAYDQAVGRLARFLRLPAWEMERAGLLRDIDEAARRWHGLLTELDAKTLANEIWLAGEAHGITLHGKADTLLELPGGAILIVDHKKSSSAARRDRMRAGWDLQAGLYHDMLARPTRREGDGLDTLIGRRISIAYHTMNDGVLLTSGLALPPPARDMGDGVNTQALAFLAERLAQLGAGRIVLNTSSDEKWFQKEARITAYALRDGSPLVRACIRDVEAPE